MPPGLLKPVTAIFKDSGSFMLERFMLRIEHFVLGQWVSSVTTDQNLVNPISHAVTGEQIAESCSADLDFKDILRFGREVGGPALRLMTFRERAEILKRLALMLVERKEEFYLASQPTGTTRADAWIDIEGGIGTLFAYASRGRKECADTRWFLEGRSERLSRNDTFSGQHVCVPLEGVALHINAFNFPCWGMLEKLAPTILAGMPAIVKPATVSCYLAAKMVKAIDESGILPRGALQIICGGIGNSFDFLTSQDVVTFTGSQQTGVKLRAHPRIISESVRFNMESDSLNCSILGPDAAPGSEEFELFVKEVAREMTVKAGQKCTVIRRAIVPKQWEEAVINAVNERISRVKIGDPGRDDVQMGPLISCAHREDVRAQLAELLKVAERVSNLPLDVLGADSEKGAFFAPTLLRCSAPLTSPTVHAVEVFGPVTTVMPYDSLDEAIEIAKLGEGSLVGSLFTADDAVARQVLLGAGAYHGRLLVVNRSCGKDSTGHGSPMPMLVHGGPGRAGGGEELGGMRSVFHYLQRVALQGSPTTIANVTESWIRGAEQKISPIHPFRKHFEELDIGETFHTGTRTISEQDIESFAKLSGDFFYAHMDDAAAKASLFGQRVAHGYFVLAAAAGLFVDPAPGPVVANYGLERLRFIAPVLIGDTIQVRITCKEKIPREGEDQGVVHWDVEVQNQRGETVAVYVLLTLVKRLEKPTGQL